MVKNIKGQSIYCNFSSFSPKNKNNLSTILISLLVCLMGIFLLSSTAYLTSITPENIISLTNEERIKNNLSALTANQFLTKAAYQKGQTIFNNQIFQHNINDQKFSTWIYEADYLYSYVGENLAIDFMTSEGVVKAWMNSPTHKKNLLNSYFKETGVAVIESEFKDHNTILVVQIFGTPPQTIVSPKILGTTDSSGQLNQGEQQIANLAYAPEQIKTVNPEKLLTHSIKLERSTSLINTANLNINPAALTITDFQKNTLVSTQSTGSKIFSNSINSIYLKIHYLTQFFNILFFILPLILILFLGYLYGYYFSFFAGLTKNKYRYHRR